MVHPLHLENPVPFDQIPALVYNVNPLDASLKSNPHTSNRRKPRKASSYHSSSRSVPSILVLCLLALFLPCTFSHVLPQDSGSDAIGARSPVRHVSDCRFDGTILEKGAFLSQYQYNSVSNPQIRTIPSKSSSSTYLSKRQSSAPPAASTCRCGREPLSPGRKAGYAIVVVVLVLLSGVFAGLTLGYMSLDETQLQVLMTTGDEIQKARAAKILPIRKDGHLLLTTLLIANMITNETLPIIFDPLLPTEVLSVVISTVLIVIFAELIPQSTCSRYGLQIGAYMAFPTRIIIIILWPVAYPVSRILHWVLGPHHGIVYRRAELKELVTMHAASGGRGGDLKGDTVMIVGGALDLQEKVVKQAMTPIDEVFMLPFTAKLDYPTLERVVRSGHSRIPIFQEIEVQVSQVKSGSTTPKKKLPLLSSFSRKAINGGHDDLNATKTDHKDLLNPGDNEGIKTVIRKKIVGTLLVKSCVLLDPEDAVPVSSMVINALPTVPGDEPLLNVLNVFQEGRSHMAIVSPRSRRGLSDSIADLGSKSNLYRGSQGPAVAPGASAAPRVDGLGDIDEEKHVDGSNEATSRTNRDAESASNGSATSSGKTRHDGSPKRRHLWSRAFGREEKGALEQVVPSDATISEKRGSEFQDLRKWESHQSTQTQAEGNDGLPLGIITLEDVLEELLGEEILDEYDDRGNEEQDFRNLMPPPSPEHEMVSNVDNGLVEDAKRADEKELRLPGLAMETTPVDGSHQQLNASSQTSPPVSAKKTMLTRLGLTRQRSQRDSPVPFSNTAIMVDEPGVIEGTDATPSATLTSQGGGYFDDVRGNRTHHSIRSSSVPPAGERDVAEERRGRSASRPQTPSGAVQPSTPLLSPQPNRPIVIRTQAPGGNQVTTIANENLLRGRQPSLPNQTALAPSSAAAAASAAAVAAASSSSRSQTPAGGAGAGNSAGVNKGNRFKSQAAVGVGGITTGATTSATSRSKSQAPQDLSSSIGSLDDTEDKKS